MRERIEPLLSGKATDSRWTADNRLFLEVVLQRFFCPVLAIGIVSPGAFAGGYGRVLLTIFSAYYRNNVDVSIVSIDGTDQASACKGL
ncbi:MAG: hypothetical protein OXC62_15645 [Aestuariivita sp.]|nr:hypothetical protein [Aestuariivita sp.]